LAASCAKVDVDLRSKSSDGPSEEALNFTDTTSDGRPVQYAVIDPAKYDNIDFTKVHPKTQQFFGLASATAVKLRNTPTDFRRLFEYTNIQESVPEDLFLLGVKRACQEEFPGSSLRACIDEGIAKSGALVFQQKVPRANPANLNDEKYALDVAYGTLGVTGVTVTAPDGTTHKAMMFTCAGCHSSVEAHLGSDNSRMLYVDGRGTSTIGDGMANRAFQPYADKAKAVLNNPADPFWTASAKTKAGGLLASQYELFRTAHGSRYYATDADLAEAAKKLDSQKVVNSGWLLAMMAAGASAKASCGVLGSGQVGVLGAKRGGLCQDTLSDDTVAEKTQWVSPELFLPGGARQNIFDEIFVTGNPIDNVPTRAGRSLVPNRYTTQDALGSVPNVNFAIEYLTMVNVDSNGFDRISSRYLLAATSAYVPFPAMIDANIAKTWYGPTATPASARAALDQSWPRTVLRDFVNVSPLYHKARYTQPEPVASVHAPTMTVAEVAQAEGYVGGQCFNCHVTAAFNVNQALSACGPGTTDCVLNGQQRPVMSYTSFYKQDTPTSMFASRMFGQIGSIPAALGGISQVAMNVDIKGKPSRIPFLYGLSLTNWGYLSFADALKINRPQPFYAVVAPVINTSGVTQVRTMNVAFSLAGNGVTGVQELRCNKTQTFNIGGVVKSCRDTLIQLSGATPRLLGEDRAIGVHGSLVRPESVGVSPAVVSKYLSALAVGRLNVPGYRPLTFTYAPELWSDAGAGTGGGTGGGSTGGGTGDTTSGDGSGSGGAAGGGGMGPMEP